MPDAQKLLFVAPSAYPLGGVQVWLDDMLAGLGAQGWRVELALTAGRFHDPDAYLAKHPFAPAHIVSAPTGTRAGRIRALRDCFESTQPDIVAGVNLADVYSAVVEARARGASGMKAVATLHGLQPDFLADFRANAPVLDAVICSNRLAQRLVSQCCGLSPDRVLYAPYGVREERSVRRDQSRPFRLCYVGRIEVEQKRVFDLLDIVARARTQGMDVELLVAGDGPQASAFIAEIGARRLENHVTLLGALPAQDIREAVYARADALIVTSNWETGPIVAWEAMMAGLPVLTAAYVGHRAEGALVDGVNCAIFPIGDIAVAVERLRALMDISFYERVAESGRALVRERYTLEKSVRQWAEQFCVAASLPKLPPPLWWSAVAPAGRLDRFFGNEMGETLRRVMRRGFVHTEPGGEWPHAYGIRAMSEAQFRAESKRLERGVA